MQFKVGIGVLGCGTVGESVATRLYENQDSIEDQSGVRYDLRAIAIRDASKVRETCLRRDLLSTNPRSVIDDPHVDVIVECIGGIAESAELIEHALDRGRHVVTANKDLIATQGPRLQALASLRGVSLRYEAAVGGAVPIIRSVGEALAGDEVRAIAGVFNGTCTSILSAMENGATYDQALDDAKRKGYAEADPLGDVSGLDTAHKLAVLIQRAFRLGVLSSRIRYSGIAEISAGTVSRARKLGFRIRLVAATVRTPTGVLAQVTPVLLAKHHSFSRTDGVDNIARIVARDAGELELRGAGAGGAATASAVLGDVVSVLRSLGEGHRLAGVTRFRALGPAIEVVPFFEAPRFHKDVPNIPIWDDELLYVSRQERGLLLSAAAS